MKAETTLRHVVRSIAHIHTSCHTSTPLASTHLAFLKSLTNNSVSGEMKNEVFSPVTSIFSFERKSPCKKRTFWTTILCKTACRIRGRNFTKLNPSFLPLPAFIRSRRPHVFVLHTFLLNTTSRVTPLRLAPCPSTVRMKIKTHALWPGYEWHHVYRLVQRQTDCLLAFTPSPPPFTPFRHRQLNPLHPFTPLRPRQMKTTPPPSLSTPTDLGN